MVMVMVTTTTMIIKAYKVQAFQPFLLKNVDTERGGLCEKKEEFHCVVVVVVESPSLGMFSYCWPGLS